ncbi:hypothetical protein [Fundidesulfovibrio terrae]|uniref:hypothetical protein n=1 Tax=Fundidesulfovibrio terrae TaxID=2922866 RepID=UPI001FAED552|nr:hypothetical protein [Fundidesulfovibrio terrae]
MTRTRLAMVLCLALGVCLPAFARAQDKDPAQTVISVCTRCHTPARICKNLGVKDQDAWDATVSHMIRNGAKLDAADKPGLVSWLASRKPGDKPVCN